MTLNNLKNFLKNNYDIGKIEKISLLNSSSNNKNYLINSSTGKYVLHVLNEEIKKQQIDKICQILEFCNNKGGKVTIPIKNIYKKYVIDDIKIYLTKYSYGKNFSGKEKEFEDLSFELANLHKILKTCKISFRYNLNKNFYKILSKNEIEKIKNLINTKTKKDKFDYYILKNFSKFEEIHNNFFITQPRKKSLKYQQIVHYDLHPDNVLFSKNHVSSFLDFNSIRVDTLIEDLAFSSFRFSLLMDSSLTIDKRMKFFVSKYLQKNKIKISSYEILSCLIQRILRGISYILKKRYFFNENSWISDLKKYFEYLTIISTLTF